MSRRTPTRGPDTPLMQQYRDIKAQHTDAILFFRMGDFYEMFLDDAQLAARELGITLTSRNNGGGANIPLAGVPVKAAAQYVRRLVQKGFRVAICEQIEDPKLAKGVVKRQVIETVTPGAVLTDDLLDGVRNNFLAAVAPGEPRGLAAIDVSTGEFVLECVESRDLEAALARLEPREVVLPTDDEPHGIPDSVLVTRRDSWEFDSVMGGEEIQRRFGLASLDGLGVTDDDRPSLAAAAALLAYVRTLQPQGLPHMARPHIRRIGGTMPLDEMTRRNLELAEPLRPGGNAPTLLSVIDRTVTPMGARLLRQWLLAPLRNAEAIRARLDAVEVLHTDARSRERLRDALDEVRDLERLAGRAATGRATPRDLGALRRSLECLPDIRGALDGLAARERSAELERVAEQTDLLTDLMDKLAGALVDRPPATLGDGDTIRPGTDEVLDTQRDLRDGGKQFIAALQGREREATGITNLKVGYNRVFGYYLEVTKTHKDAVPAHYERRQTLTGAERYVTPELKEYEAKVLGAEEQVLHRERELIAALCVAVGERIGRIQTTAHQISQADVFAALAETAAANGYVRPEITDSFALDLMESRHPVVEHVLPQGKFIPNAIRLDAAGRVVVLTGPNMAGKSTVLRQIGLNVVLAQAGSFVPCTRATMGVVDRVFTRVGASDDLSRGQSTFMVEMSETSAILHAATAASLVLLDEIGRGTSTYDGVAIAWAVTEHLHDVVGCKTLFATHYHELTQLTEELQHARNFNVAVQETGDTIVFRYRLEPGGADRSYGIHVGQLAGLPTEVVRRAGEILAALEAGHHVAGVVPPPPPDANQLPLFSGDHPVLSELRTLDPDTMTPLEALARLADLKKRAEP